MSFYRGIIGDFPEKGASPECFLESRTLIFFFDTKNLTSKRGHLEGRDRAVSFLGLAIATYPLKKP